MKSLVLARMKEEGLAEPDMKPSDVDLEKDYVSSESRFVLGYSTVRIRVRIRVRGSCMSLVLIPLMWI